MTSVRLAAAAMATRFELVLRGQSEAMLRAAGEEAIAEILRIESALSVYRPESEIAALNRDAATRAIRVTPELFALVRHALVLCESTGGAFDITVGPLLRAWGLMRGMGRVPSAAEVVAARACLGPGMIQMNDSEFTIRFARPGVMLDLGSIGKGYALDRAAEILRESGVDHALLHGGTSTAVARGQALDGDAWKIAIEAPAESEGAENREPLAVVMLHDESLSVSAVWGKGFEAGGRFYGHVIDPRVGHPVDGVLLAAMVLPSATESDALSTALLVGGGEMVDRLREQQVSSRCLVVEAAAGPCGYRVVASGISTRVE